MNDKKYDELRELIAKAEKPLDLRDQLAIQVLNGLISNSKSENDLIQELLHYLTYDSEEIKPRRRNVEENAAKKMEKIIRNCYKVADIMRKVRLSTFE